MFSKASDQEEKEGQIRHQRNIATESPSEKRRESERERVEWRLVKTLIVYHPLTPGWTISYWSYVDKSPVRTRVARQHALTVNTCDRAEGKGCLQTGDRAHRHTRTCAYTFTHVYTLAYMYTLYTDMSTDTQLRTQKYTHSQIHSISSQVCMYDTYIHTNTHTHIHTRVKVSKNVKNQKIQEKHH